MWTATKSADYSLCLGHQPPALVRDAPVQIDLGPDPPAAAVAAVAKQVLGVAQVAPLARARVAPRRELRGARRGGRQGQQARGDEDGGAFRGHLCRLLDRDSGSFCVGVTKCQEV